MHLSRTNTSPTEIKLVIKASAEELQKAKNIAVKHMASHVKVAGFREGKVPLALAEKQLDQNLLQSEVIEETINKLYASAIKQEELRPISQPQIAIKKFVPFTDLEFEAVVPTIGKIKLADYTKIKVEEKPIKVEKADVDKVVTSLQERVAEYKEVTRASKEGDQVLIDFVGTDAKDQPVAGADGTDYPLILGSNSFIPGFETNVIGMKASDTRSFTVTFPKDYGVKALQSKKVTFKVTVKKVSEIILPKLDDDFAATVGPFQTLIELKADIKKQIEIERSREAESVFENEVLEAVAAKSTIELPDSLVEEQIDRIESEEKQNLVYRGLTFEEHLKEEGVNHEQHREQKRPVAEQRVKIGVMLSEIAEKEKITVSPEEIEIRLQMLKAQYQDATAQAELAKPEALRDLNARLMTEKTLNKLKGYVRGK